MTRPVNDPPRLRPQPTPLGSLPVGRQVNLPETTQRNSGEHSPYIRSFWDLRRTIGMVGQPAQEAGMNSLYVGIDIAKATFVAAVHGPAGESVWGEFANTPAGFEQWRAR